MSVSIFASSVSMRPLSRHQIAPRLPKTTTNGAISAQLMSPGYTRVAHGSSQPSERDEATHPALLRLCSGQASTSSGQASEEGSRSGQDARAPRGGKKRSFFIPSWEGKRKRVQHLLGGWRTRFLFVPRRAGVGFLITLHDEGHDQPNADDPEKNGSPLILHIEPGLRPVHRFLLFRICMLGQGHSSPETHEMSKGLEGMGKDKKRGRGRNPCLLLSEPGYVYTT